MTEPEDCAAIPPLALEMVLAGEAPPGWLGERWARHIEGCPHCRARLAEARAAGERW
jgi:hypothetical protein